MAWCDLFGMKWIPVKTQRSTEFVKTVVKNNDFDRESQLSGASDAIQTITRPSDLSLLLIGMT